MKRKLEDIKKMYETSYKRNLTINTDIKYLPCDLCGNLTSLFRIMSCSLRSPRQTFSLCTTPYVACSDDCLLCYY